eukprot:COSAG02_NODE_247_length_27137_cov_61.275057_14_plen_555_part_00
MLRCRMWLVAAALAGLLLGIDQSARVEATTLFVAPPCSFPPRSPCGDDKNDGSSADTPLATLTKARDMLRAASDAEAKEVMLAEGLYELSEVLELTAADSGTMWAATGNVTLSGGEAMNPGWLKQVMNSDVLSQLPSDDARKHVRKVELWEHFLGDGVTLGNFSVRGSVNANAALTLDMLKPAGIEFFDPLDEVAYVPARYPNADTSGGFSKIRSIKEGTNNTFTPEDAVKQRLPQWLPQRQFGHGSGDIWCHGYWSNRWSDAHYSLDSITDDGELVLGGVPEALADRTKEVCSGDCKPSKYDDAHKGGSYYCYNLLAELDAPGEMYLNRSSGTLYIWPLNPAQYGFANVTASKLQSIVSISGGAKDIQLRGLHFRHTRDAAVVVRDTHDILIHGGSVGLAGSMGVNISGGTNVTVSEVTVFGCGSGGVFLDGGDRPSLTPSGHSLIGSEIRNNSRWVYAMCPAVFLGGVNQSVRNTTISLHPHISVWVQGNDHTFEENNISDVCTWALDSGALYSGRDYTYRGAQSPADHWVNAEFLFEHTYYHYLRISRMPN